MERKKIKIEKVLTNDGQIEGLPANPRKINDDEFQKLVESIKSLPEMTEVRDLIVVEKDGMYITIGGNMRLLVYQKLGYKQVPCCILPADTSVEKLRKITMLDNKSYGENDWQAIKSDWDIEELKTWGVELPKFMNEDNLNLDNFFKDESKKPSKKKVIKCPKCGEEIEI